MNRLVIFAVVFAAACAALLAVNRMGFSADPPTSPEFEARTFKNAASDTLPYRLMKPANYDAKQKYPLVVFLHGAGERGNDNQRQLTNGVLTFAKPDMRTKYPCFMIVPQCPAGQSWGTQNFGAESGAMSKDPTPPMKLAIELIAEMQKEFSIDAKRLYVTGLSMGGFGTWDIICRNPTMFAAAVPICGGGDESKAASIAKMPIWAFHGSDDKAVKVTRSQNMIKAIKDAGGTPKYTEYPGVAHNSWVKAYADPELYAWMFAQHLP